MSGELIFIVDDNPLNLKLVDFLLSAKGYEVRSAPDGKSALKKLTTCQPDLILMDIQLPDINGLDLTQKLKKDLKYRDIPIVALTAYAMEGDKEKILASGCDGYISKPIDTTTLPEIVADYLSKRSKT